MIETANIATQNYLKQDGKFWKRLVSHGLSGPEELVMLKGFEGRFESGPIGHGP